MKQFQQVVLLLRTLDVSDDITAFWTSDENLKIILKQLMNHSIRFFLFMVIHLIGMKKSNKTGHDVGLIAQEIEQVLPEALSQQEIMDILQ